MSTGVLLRCSPGNVLLVKHAAPGAVDSRAEPGHQESQNQEGWHALCSQLWEAKLLEVSEGRVVSRPPPTAPHVAWVLVSVSAGFVTSRGQAFSRVPHVRDCRLCSLSLCVIVAIFPQWRNEAQRGEGLCPRSHSKHVEEQGCKAWFSRLPGGEAGDGCQGLSDQGASFLSLLLGEQMPVRGD